MDENEKIDKKWAMGLKYSLKIIDNAPTVEITDKLAKVMIDNGITDFDEFAKRYGVSYLHQDSITKSDTQI